jgi:hypothetical protein
MIEPQPITASLLKRTRASLGWLGEDGYRETDALVVGSRFHLTFDGPHGRVTVNVNPGMSAIEIWLQPRSARHRASLQEYLTALKLLRDKELAGDWTPLTDEWTPL